MDQVLGWVKKHRAWVAIAVIAAVLIFFVLPKVFGARNSATTREEALTAQYNANQIELSSYVQGFYEQLGILQGAESEALSQIFADALQGRYGDQGFSVDSAFFSAVMEAYPDLTNYQDQWGDLQTYIQAKRDAFANVQKKLQDMVRDYNTWRGQIGNAAFLWLTGGTPGSHLRVDVGSVQLSGQDALDKMSRPILASEAQEAFETGISDPLEVPSS